MARIPVYESGVRTDPLANKRASAFITPAAAGAGFSEAISRLGNGLADVAEAMDYKDQITDKADSDNAYNQYMEHRRQVLYDPETGYLNQSGSNALGGSREAALDELQKRREAVEAGLSPRALADFKRRADGVDNTVKDNAIKHASAQTRVYSGEQTAAAVKASLDAAGLAYNDEETSNAYLNEALNGLTEKALLEGWPKEKLDEARAAAVSDTLVQRAIHMAADDPVLADQFLDERQDDINQNQYLELKEGLKGAVLSKKANGVVGEIFKPGSAAAAPPRSPAALEQGARLLETGKTVLGLDENTSNDAIREYLRTGGVDMNPAVAAWSAAYVNGTLGHAGLQGTSSNMARSFLGWGQDASADPQVGDIIVMERGSAPHGYVGFIAGVNEDGTFSVLGGDQGGEVVRGTRSAPRVSSSGNAGPPVIRYTNQNATRNRPPPDRLTSALSFLPELGVEMEVFSGGQPAKGSGKPRVGTERHDHGDAADVFFYKDGRKLDWADPNDRPIFEEIVRRGRAAGLTGFGAGDNYMQSGSMHIGFGNPGVWGAGGKGANAPEWLREAFNNANGAATVSTSGSTGTQLTDNGVVGIKMNVPTDRVLGIRRGTTVSSQSADPGVDLSNSVSGNDTFAGTPGDDTLGGGGGVDAAPQSPNDRQEPDGNDLSAGLGRIMAIPDPELRNEAFKQFEQRIKVRDAREALEREQLMDDAWTRISEGNENPDNIAPEVQTRIGAAGMASLREAYRQKITGADVTHPATGQYFLDLQLSRDPEKQKEFAETNLNDFSGELSEGVLTKLKIAQAELRQSIELKKSGQAADVVYEYDDYIEVANRGKEQFEVLLGDLGTANSGTKQMWVNFQDEVKKRLRAYADANGAQMPDREVDAMLGGLLAKTTITGKTRHGVSGRAPIETIAANIPYRPGGTEVDISLTETDIPFSERERITKVLTIRWERKPTVDEVVDQYEMELLHRAGLRPELEVEDIPGDIVKGIRSDHPNGISDEDIVELYKTMMASPLTTYPNGR